MTKTAGDLALAIQTTLKEAETAYPDDANIKKLHRMATSAALRSFKGETLTADDLTALGIAPATEVTDDALSGPGTDKS